MSDKNKVLLLLGAGYKRYPECGRFDSKGIIWFPPVPFFGGMSFSTAWEDLLKRNPLIEITELVEETCDCSPK